MNFGFLDINPAVRNDVAEGWNIGFVLQVQLVDQQPNGDEIPIRQTLCNGCDVVRNVIHTSHQILQRHGGDEQVACNFLFLAVLLVGQGENLAGLVGVNLGDFTVHENLTAHLFDFGSGDFPELTRTILRVIEFFNQGSFHLAVGLIRIQLGEHVLDNGSDGQALDTLRAPVCGDFSRMATPQLFGVALEEHGIQLFAETIDIEVFQRGFFLFADGAL